MKKLLLFLIIPFLSFGQNVNIPDVNFKSYLVGSSEINTNDDDEIQLSEASAFSGWINCQELGISDLTGIEAFTSVSVILCGWNELTELDLSQNTALTSLNCNNNQLTSLNVSQNTDLGDLRCWNNQLTSLDIGQNSSLFLLACWNNQLTSLDISQNTDLSELHCENNQIASIDVSQHTELTYLTCQNNQLTYLNVANGNNLQMGAIQTFNASNNPNLNCIEVDNLSWSNSNWTVSEGHIDTQHFFSENCNETEIEEYIFSDKNLVKTTDILGRETNKNNGFQLHIYDDGSVEKKYLIK